MNEANDFYEDMKSRKQQVMDWRQGSTTDDGSEAPSSEQSGNGELKRSSGPTTTKDGIPSRTEKDLNMTPNG